MIGVYYIYLFINETLIKNCPLELQIEKSAVEEENQLKIQENHGNEEIKRQDIFEKQKETDAKQLEEQLNQEKKLQTTGKNLK